MCVSLFMESRVGPDMTEGKVFDAKECGRPRSARPHGSWSLTAFPLVSVISLFVFILILQGVLQLYPCHMMQNPFEFRYRAMVYGMDPKMSDLVKKSDPTRVRIHLQTICSKRH